MEGPLGKLGEFGYNVADGCGLDLEKLGPVTASSAFCPLQASFPSLLVTHYPLASLPLSVMLCPGRVTAAVEG